MKITNLLNEQAIVYEKSFTQNGLGENEISLNVKYANMPCRLQYNLNKVFNSSFDKGNYLSTTYTIYAENVYDVKDSDIIEIKNIKYEVVKSLKDSSKHHLEIKCELIKN